VKVESKDGNGGELTVLVDGQVVSQKTGDSLPAEAEVVAAVKKATPQGAGI
jgi:hypothetical protein